MNTREKHIYSEHPETKICYNEYVINECFSNTSFAFTLHLIYSMVFAMLKQCQGKPNSSQKLKNKVTLVT